MTAPSRHRTFGRDPEQGVALLLVLVVLVGLGVVAVPLLELTRDNFRKSTVVQTLDRRIYGVDGGVTAAIQSLRGGSALCLDGAPMDTLTVNGRLVEVRCVRVAGGLGGLGPGGWSLYLNDTGSSDGQVLTQSASNDPLKVIEGPVYNGRGDAGWSLQADLTIDRGELRQPPAVTADCNTLPNARLKTVGFTKVSCGIVPTPPSTESLPGAEPPPADPAGTDAGGGCKVFQPGTYTSPPELANNNYFASDANGGVYYFKNLGDWEISKNVVAGRPRSGQAPEPLLGLTPCSVTGADDGVTFVVGGSTRIVIDKGSLEIFASTADASVPGVGLMAKGAGSPAWLLDPVAMPTPILDFSQGNGSRLALHGVTWAPNSAVRLYATNSGVAKLMNSVVVGRLDLQAAASIQPESFGLHVETGTGFSTNRLIARSVPSSEKELCAYATVTLRENAEHTADVQSWRVDNALTSGGTACNA